MLFLGLPLLVLRGALGAHRAPGIAEEPLFSALYAAGQVRRWMGGVAPWGSADVALDADSFWPASPLPAFLQAALEAVVGPGPALAGVLLLGGSLAGWGTWRLVRRTRPEVHPLAALLAGLSVQLSPAVARAPWAADLVVLSVGPLALALAARSSVGRVAGCLLAGAWSPAAGVLAGLGHLLARRPAGLAGMVPLGLALLLPSADLPGSSRQQAAAPDRVPAWVAAGGAVFPLAAEPAMDRPLGGVGAAEQAGAGAGPAGRVPPPPGPHPAGPAAHPPPPTASPASGITSLPARIHGGPLVALGVILALVLPGARRWGLAGAVVLLALGLVLGGVPLPGEAPPAPRVLAAAGSLPVVGSGAWLGLAVLAAALGMGAAASRWWGVGLALAAGVAWVTPAPPWRPGLPVTPLPPQPAVEALQALPPGGVLVVPEPAAPFRQGHRSVAEVLWLATRHGHPVGTGAGAPPDPAVVAHVARVADLPVDQAAAEVIWAGRHLPPLARARDGGFVALLLDRGALPPAGRGAVEQALTDLLGPPLAVGDTWQAHVIGPAGAGTP